MKVKGPEMPPDVDTLGSCRKELSVFCKFFFFLHFILEGCVSCLLSVLDVENRLWWTLENRCDTGNKVQWHLGRTRRLDTMQTLTMLCFRCPRASGRSQSHRASEPNPTGPDQADPGQARQGRAEHSLLSFDSSHYWRRLAPTSNQFRF